MKSFIILVLFITNLYSKNINIRSLDASSLFKDGKNFTYEDKRGTHEVQVSTKPFVLEDTKTKMIIKSFLKKKNQKIIEWEITDFDTLLDEVFLLEYGEEDISIPLIHYGIPKIMASGFEKWVLIYKGKKHFVRSYSDSGYDCESYMQVDSSVYTLPIELKKSFLGILKKYYKNMNYISQLEKKQFYLIDSSCRYKPWLDSTLISGISSDAKPSLFTKEFKKKMKINYNEIAIYPYRSKDKNHYLVLTSDTPDMTGHSKIKVFSFLEEKTTLKKEWMVQDFGKNIYFSYMDFKLKNLATNEWVSPIIAYTYLDKSNNSICKVISFAHGKKITLKMYQKSYKKNEVPYIVVSKSFYELSSKIQKMMVQSMGELMQDAVAVTFFNAFRLDEAMKFKPKIIYLSVSYANGDGFNNSVEEHLEFFE